MARPDDCRSVANRRSRSSEPGRRHERSRGGHGQSYSTPAAILALVCLLLTVLWLGLLLGDMTTAGPLETFEQVAAHAGRLGWLFYATYINAALSTVCATALLAALHAFLRPAAPPWILIRLVFTPVYTVLNLIAYLSQLVIVPPLLA